MRWRGCSRPGYAYPASEISNWYDPIAYLTDRITNHDVYLPVAKNAFAPAPACQENQNLLHGGAFDDMNGSQADPDPWLPVATTSSYLVAWPLHYNATPPAAPSGLVGKLGVWSYDQPTDEELTQSFVVPPGTANLWLTFDYLITSSAPPNPPIMFKLAYFDSVTGHNLLGTWCQIGLIPSNWSQTGCTHAVPSSLANRNIRLAVTTQTDTFPDSATFYIDNIRVKTHCTP